MSQMSRRTAFTLVELLVVTGLIASLLSLVIVAMRPTAESQVRELARNLQSALMQAQTRSLTNGKGACLVLEPSSTVASRTVYLGEIRPTLSTTMQAPAGATLDEVLTTGSPNLFNTGTAVAVFITPQTDDVAALEAGYRVRFSTGSSYGPWYDFSYIADVNGGNAVSALLTRPQAGIDPATNIWPITTGNQIPCEIVRQPGYTQIAVAAPKLASIDLRYSGLGDHPAPLSFTASGNAPSYWYSSLQSAMNERISLEFNRIGSLDGVFRFALPPAKPWATPIASTSPLYLLVATNDDIAADRSLQSNVSMWIVVTPQSGTVRVGKNIPAAWPPTAGLGKEALEQTYADWFRERRANVR
jgi:type II secretory pathway pseudopilin PulG